MMEEETVQYYEVKVGGQTLRVTHERGPEYIQAVAAYVEQKLQARAGDPPAPMRLALMAALEIADELFTSEVEHGQKVPRRESLQ
jgi:cell division protein ZapA (FtsZ GTPase activity inhibitor)